MTMSSSKFTRLRDYASLMRLDKPIGIFLLLWPTLWALLIASGGNPDPKVLLIFVAGVVLMRSAGCVINDYADREFDRHVSRTQNRPLTAGRVTTKEARVLFVILCLFACAGIAAEPADSRPVGDRGTAGRYLPVFETGDPSATGVSGYCVWLVGAYGLCCADRQRAANCLADVCRHRIVGNCL